MQAEFFILPDSFKYNSKYSKEEIEFKIKALSQDVLKILSFKDSNKLFTNYSEIFDVVFCDGLTLADFVFSPIETKKVIDRDVVNAVQQIFERAQGIELSSQEVIEDLLPKNSHEISRGLIVFHPVDGLSADWQLVYGISEWLAFRRRCLAMYPDLPKFISECSRYFENLYFHDSVSEGIAKILDDFSIDIVANLSHLNDVFYGYRTRSFVNETIKYQTLTAECNLPAPAAPKDRNSNKQKLTFVFKDSLGADYKVVCYPHLKVTRSNKYPGDDHVYHHRIYFHEGVVEICEKRILIAHIGEHL